jgi:hypothetical protein
VTCECLTIAPSFDHYCRQATYPRVRDFARGRACPVSRQGPERSAFILFALAR